MESQRTLCAPHLPLISRTTFQLEALRRARNDQPRELRTEGSGRIPTIGATPTPDAAPSLPGRTPAAGYVGLT